MSLRARRQRRREIKAAQVCLGYLKASTRRHDEPMLPEEMIVEGWLWLVAGEDQAARDSLAGAIATLGKDLPEHWDEWWDAQGTRTS